MAGVKHRLHPGSRPALRERSSDGKEYHDDRDLAEVEFRGLRQELVEWQKRLYAEGKQRLLVVLQAMDAGGKDSTIRHVFEGVNPQGVRYLRRTCDQLRARGGTLRYSTSLPGARDPARCLRCQFH